MSKVRFISVPLNKKGIEEYYHGIEDTRNIKVFELNEDEFEELYSSGIFEEINSMCRLLIDDYESEILDKKNLELSQNILKNYNLEYSKFNNALELAIKKDTLVGLDF